jgi:hypothetical protein
MTWCGWVIVSVVAKALHFFVTSGKNHPFTQRRISKDVNPEI